MDIRKKQIYPISAETPRSELDRTATGEGRPRNGGIASNDDAGLNRLRRQASDVSEEPVLGSTLLSRKRKKIVNFGTWNVRTLREMGKMRLLINELEHWKMNITGLSEIRWKGSGHFDSNNHCIIYSGNDEGTGGVAIILDPVTKKSLISYDAISNRILLVKLDSKPVRTNIIQVYAPTSQSSEEDSDQFFELLQSVKDKLKDRELCVIMGDFNAKVGEGEERDSGLGPYSLGIRNERGDKLLTFTRANNLVLANTLFNHHPRKRYTWISPDQQTRNQIDFILVNDRWKTSVLDSRSKPGADCDTDHLLVSAKIRLKTFKKKSPQTAPRYDIERLEENSCHEKYNVSVENKFSVLLDVLPEESPPEHIWQEMKKIFHEAAEETIGKRARKKTKPWITDEALQMAAEKRNARQSNNKERYQQLKREVQQVIRRDKRQWLSNECNKITEYDDQHKSKELFKQIKTMTRKPLSAKQMSVKDKQGNTLTDPGEVLTRWNEYGKELFCSPENEIKRKFTKTTETEPPPLVEEVESAVKHLKNGKSPGLDNIPAELIKHAGVNCIKTLHLICTNIWIQQEWPEDWKQQELVMLHKAGDPKECSNYRTIALISHTSKILLHIILNRLKAKIEFELAEEQAGFRAGRSTGDMLCALQILIEKLNEAKHEGYIIFIDYSKAFDNVSHDNLFTTMTKMGFPSHLVSLLRSLYTDQQATIRWNNDHSAPFEIKKGVRQGCILSPHLFSIYTEQIMREADIEETGISVGGRKISNLRYADDTALCASTHEAADQLLQTINYAGQLKNMKLNAKKTKVMHIGPNVYQPIEIDGEELEKVDKFKYLGSVKTNNGDCSTDINTRIAMAKKKMTDLATIWKDQDLSTRLKIKIMKTLVWSTVMYGSEGWTLKKRDKQRIQAAEMWFYRRLLRISWTEKRTNKSILTQLGIKRELFGLIAKRKASFFGHACRHPNCYLMKDIIQGKMASKRERGRPRAKYLDNITEWTGLAPHTIYKRAENRAEWRTDIQRAMRAANFHKDDAE